MSYENRGFIIFNVSELDKVNFSEVLETSVNTLRKSGNKTKIFVKWEGDEPSFVSTLTTKEGPYTYTQMINILNTSEWSAQEIP
jgi:hypothetical protein